MARNRDFVVKATSRKSNDRRWEPPKKSTGRLKGEGCPHSRLTDELVREMRKMYVPYRYGATKINRWLKKQGVHISDGAVCDVLYGKTWSHVK